MPKARKTVRRVATQIASMIFSCTHFDEISEIDAYIASIDKVESIADIRSAAGINAKDIAEFIVRAANNEARMKNIIHQLLDALRLCLDCDGKLTWEVEQEADAMYERINQELQTF